MTTNIRLALASVMLAAMLALACASDASSAGEGGPEKDQAAVVTKVADAIKAGKNADATKLAAKGIGKFDETSDLMHLFKTWNKGGIGWGFTRSKNPIFDGLEKRIQEYKMKVTAADAADPMNEEGAYWLASMAELMKIKPNDKGKKNLKLWGEMSDQLRAASLDFAKAAALKKADSMKTAADKVNNTCLNCHAKFK
jgi:hypothetical protein